MCCAVCKNETFTLIEKNFVNSTKYLAIYLENTLLSRNFCKKMWEQICVNSTLCTFYFSLVFSCENETFWRKIGTSHIFVMTVKIVIVNVCSIIWITLVTARQYRSLSTFRAYAIKLLIRGSSGPVGQESEGKITWTLKNVTNIS